MRGEASSALCSLCFRCHHHGVVSCYLFNRYQHASNLIPFSC